MKKVISILLALGLVLGLTVMATPVSADLSNVTCTVAASDVECELGCYTITFDMNLALSEGHWIYVEFPAGTTGLGALIPGDVTVSYWDATIPGWVVIPAAISAVNDAALQLHLLVAPGIVIPVGPVQVTICNVGNPPAGTYTVTASTNREPTKVTSSPFTINKGGVIAPVDFQWGIGSLVDLVAIIEWNGSTGVAGIVSTGFGPLALGVDYTVVVIDATHSQLTFLGSNPLSWLNVMWFDLSFICQSDVLTVSFDVGCDTTLTIKNAGSAAIALGVGWNLISLPLIPKYPAISTLLADIDANVDSVWYYDCGTWYVYKNGTSFQSLTSMEDGKSYWICMTAADILEIWGYDYPKPPSVPPKYCYHECWNMVGYKATIVAGALADTTPADNYLLSAVGMYTYVLTYDPILGWVVVDPAVDPFVVGKGYWVNFTGDACVVPPP